VDRWAVGHAPVDNLRRGLVYEIVLYSALSSNDSKEKFKKFKSAKRENNTNTQATTDKQNAN